MCWCCCCGVVGVVSEAKWSLELVSGNGLWNLSLELVSGNGLWNLSLEMVSQMVSGGGLWNWSLELIGLVCCVGLHAGGKPHP